MTFTTQVQNYKNVINPCLLDEKLDDEIIKMISPHEYHLCENHVSKITDLLFTDKTLKEFLEKKTFIRHNGGGFVNNVFAMKILLGSKFYIIRFHLNR